MAELSQRTLSDMIQDGEASVSQQMQNIHRAEKKHHESLLRVQKFIAQVNSSMADLI